MSTTTAGRIILLSTRATGRAGRALRTPALYRNNRNGTFTDVTRAAGLAVEMYGLGVAAADYDNDGDDDIYVTALGPNHLFRNNGAGKFDGRHRIAPASAIRASRPAPSGSTTTAMASSTCSSATTSHWSIETDLFCTLDGKSKSYCTPESYKGQSPTLYRQHAATARSRTSRGRRACSTPSAKTLGVALIDYDDDGWLDLFVANDTQPNRLYRNKGDGTFTDVGVMAGVAFNDAGMARAGMGVDAADYDGSGRQSLIIGNFSNEMMALYSNEGNGLFIDEAPTSTIGRASLLRLTFACFFFDFDLDGLPDIFAANGHVADDIATVQPTITYAQPPHLFRNLGARKFEDVSTRVGRGASADRSVARGAAYGDYRQRRRPRSAGDHRQQRPGAAPAQRRRRQPRAARHARSDRPRTATPIGASVACHSTAGTPVSSAMVKTGSSYLSQSELPLTFGLGGATKVSAIEVTWPNGTASTCRASPAIRAIPIQRRQRVIVRHRSAGVASDEAADARRTRAALRCCRQPAPRQPAGASICEARTAPTTSASRCSSSSTTTARRRSFREALQIAPALAHRAAQPRDRALLRRTSGDAAPEAARRGGAAARQRRPLTTSSA